MPDISLKERLARNSILVAPAAFDMVSAKVIERAGFEAVYLSGFGQSASHLGLPDAGTHDAFRDRREGSEYGKGDQRTPAGRW